MNQKKTEKEKEKEKGKIKKNGLRQKKNAPRLGEVGPCSAGNDFTAVVSVYFTSLVHGSASSVPIFHGPVSMLLDVIIPPISCLVHRLFRRGTPGTVCSSRRLATTSGVDGVFGVRGWLRTKAALPPVRSHRRLLSGEEALERDRGKLCVWGGSW